MLRNYIKSYYHGLWNNCPVPQTWVSWYLLLQRTQYRHAVVFEAANVGEYIEQIEGFLPYLTKDELRILYGKIMEDESSNAYFAGPPLLVDHSCRILNSGKVGIRKNNNTLAQTYDTNKFYLENTNMIRRSPLSYTDNRLHGESVNSDSVLFNESSIEYARNHWNNVLAIQTPTYTSIYEFSDPDDHGPTNVVKPEFVLGGCKCLFKTYVAFTEDKNDFINKYMKDMPEYRIIDDHIKLITHCTVLFKEISSGHRGGSAGDICIYDGSCLDHSKCNVCEKCFPKNEWQVCGLPSIGDKIYSYLKTNSAEIKNCYGVPTDKETVPDATMLMRAWELENNKFNNIKSKLSKEINNLS